MRGKSWGVVVVGLLLLLGGVVALAVPVSADDGRVIVECGTGFGGTGDLPGLIDAARDHSAELQGYPQANTNVAGVCEDKVGFRQLWGWALVGLGVVVAVVAGVRLRRT